MLVVHGGIGAGLWGMGSGQQPDIEWLDSKGSVRPLKSADPDTAEEADKARMSHLFNIVWSDPKEQKSGPADWRPHYISNAHRGAQVDPITGQLEDFKIKKFNAGVTKQFCERNRISMVIRSHECMNEGCDVLPLELHSTSAIKLFSVLILCGQQVQAASQRPAVHRVQRQKLR